MRVSAIQQKVYQNQLKQPKLKLNSSTQGEQNSVSFKGEGGFFYGLGGGALLSLITVCTAGAALPAIAGVAAIAGGAFGGAVLGNKLEEGN